MFNTVPQAARLVRRLVRKSKLLSACTLIRTVSAHYSALESALKSCKETLEDVKTHPESYEDEEIAAFESELPKLQTVIEKTLKASRVRHHFLKETHIMWTLASVNE